MPGAGPGRRERRLRRTVERLSGCLDAIRPRQRRVLILRAGLGPREPLSRPAVAARLGATVRAVRRIERRGLRALRASARRGACTAGMVGERPSANTAPFLVGADRDMRGGDTSGTATGRVDEPGGSGVKDDVRSGPGGAPGATLTPPDVGGIDGDGGGPPVLLLIALAFLAGFAAVWTFERRRA